MKDRFQLTERKRRLPELVLETDSGAASLLRQRRSLLIVHIHDWACTACNAYMNELARFVGEIKSWSCDVAVVMPGERTVVPDQLTSGFRVLFDPESRFELALDAPPPGVLIADQWGDIILMRSVGPEHEFPSIAELISELRYLGIRCPECEGEAL